MKFGYTIIYVNSVPETLTFYEKAFGFKSRFLHESGTYGELDTGTTSLAFASFELAQANFGDNYARVSPKESPPGIELAFVTENVSLAYQGAVDCGAYPIQAPVEKPWGQRVAYVRALEGTLIELCSPMNV